MKPEEYAKLRIKLNMTGDQFAGLLGVSTRMHWYYEHGDREIPKTIAKLVRMIAKHGIPRDL